MAPEDRVRIQHMIDAATTIAEFIVGRSRTDLDHHRMLLFGAARAIEILGEAASKVSTASRADVPAVPWAAIVSMRNRLVHGYFDTDATIVWRTASAEIPALLAQLRALPDLVAGT